MSVNLNSSFPVSESTLRGKIPQITTQTLCPIPEANASPCTFEIGGKLYPKIDALGRLLNEQQKVKNLKKEVQRLQEEVKNLQNRALPSPTKELCQDTVNFIFMQCVFKRDFSNVKAFFSSIGAFSCVNTYYHQILNKCKEGFNLRQFCPEGLTILDLKTMGFSDIEEPKTNGFEILKSFYEIAPHVKGDAGCTLLTMPKGLTFNQLVQVAKDAEIPLEWSENLQQSLERPSGNRWDEYLQQWGPGTSRGDYPVKQTCVFLLTNHIFKNSRKKNYKNQKALLTKLGCKVLTAQQLFGACVFTRKIFNKCLYCGAKTNPSWKSRRVDMIYGSSSTELGTNYYLVIGTNAKGALEMTIRNELAFEENGVGGRRKFKSIAPKPAVENSALLQDFGITTKEQYSAKLGCAPDHLQKIGVLTVADLEVLGISACPLPHLPKLQAIVENPDDFKKLQEQALEKKGAVVSCLEALAEKVKIKSESSKLHVDTMQLPWNLLQEKINATYAELQDRCKTPKTLLSAFETESHALIVDQINALIDEFNTLSSEYQTAVLKAYVSQWGVLRAWQNLQSQGINCLTDLIQQRPGTSLDFLFKMGE